VDGSVLVVGAFVDLIGAGSVYVYRFDGSAWQEEAKLNALDASTNDLFGVSVDVEADVAVIGALSGEQIPFSNTGAAYVYRYDGSSTWSEEQRLVANDGITGDQFGVSVTVSGTAVAVGSINGETLGTNSGSVYVYRFNGSTWNQEQELNSNDETTGDRFGNSVTISGSAVIAGTPRDDDDATDSGSATVFRFGGSSWGEEQKLTASTAGDGDRFGQSVGLSGNVAVAGGSFNDLSEGNAGSAYVLRHNGASWAEEQQLLASDANLDDRFGAAVGVDADVVICGAPFADTGAADSGASYVYRYDGTTWVEEQKLTATDAAASDRFGGAVAVSADAIIVGADQDDLAAGSAYIYRFDGFTTWTQEQKLTKSIPVASDQFGLAVDIDGNVAVVGCLQDGTAAANGGAAYVFRHNGTSWIQEQVLTASDASANDLLGVSVDVDGDQIIVGSINGDDAPLTNTGAAYVYTYDGTSWTEETKLIGTDSVSGDQFGIAVAIDGDQAIAGARQDQDAGADTGAAYIFRRTSNFWVQQEKWTASDKSSDSQLGRSLKLDGGRGIVGAPRTNAGATCSGAVYVFDAPTGGIVVDSSDDPVSGGASFNFTNCGGTPGFPSILCLVKFDAIPFIVSLGGMGFSAQGCWVFPATVNPSSIVIGHTLSFVTFGLHPSGDIELSEEELVTFVP
jgi:hypothetical protein